MKKFYLSVGFGLCLFSIFFFTAFRAKAQMREVYLDSNANNSINRISFYSPSQGFVGFTNWIGFTTDSGKTFVQKPITNSNVNYNGNFVNITFGFQILGVKAFNADTLIAYGDYGLVPSILYSIDGGNTFTLVYWSQYNPLQLFTGITDMVFPQNDNIGYAIDADRVLKTTNKGLSWTMIRNDPSSFFDFLEAIDDNNVIACSRGHATDAAAKILKTTNGGVGWVSLSLPSNINMLYYATFLTSAKGLISAGDEYVNDGRTYYTTDAGNTWVQKNDPAVTPFETSKMHFINDSTGYALAGLFGVSKTTDSGRIWEPLAGDVNYSYLGYGFNDLFFQSNNQFWTGGDHGFLELTSNGGGVPLPKAFFRIDTTGLYTTNTVNLINYSRTGYQYKWYRNNVLFATGYNASYLHNINNAGDTIQLVTINGVNTDTATQRQYFYVPPPPPPPGPPTIYSLNTYQAFNGTTLTITGTNFTNVTAVSFGGTPATSFAVTSPTTILAVLGAGSTGNVTVTTLYGTATSTFTFIATSTTLTSFSPTSGGPGTIVTLNGREFAFPITSVQFGGVAVTTLPPWTNPNTISVAVGSGASGDVSITTPNGTSALPGFTFIPPPVLKSFAPTAADSGQLVTIIGTNLATTSAVSFGNFPAKSFTVINDTMITAVVGVAANGYLKVTTSPLGIDSLPGFIYTTPVINSFSPSTGGQGMLININGKNLTGVTVVSFGGTAASSFVVNNDSSITATIASGASGDVLVVSPHGFTASHGFLYNSTSPVIGSFSPTSGPVGTTVTISGANFNAVAANDIVYFGSVKATVISATSNTIVVTAPAGTTFQPISVTANNLTTYFGKPFILTFTPGDIITSSFTGMIKFPLGSKPSGLCMGDFDGDGRSDLAVKLTNSVGVFKNISVNGGINFSPKISLPMQKSVGGNIVVADINGDGLLDIVGSDSTGIVVLKNISTTPGTIVFAPEQVIPVSTYHTIYKLAFGDFNGDGKPDIALVDIGSIYVLINTSANGVISFAAPFIFQQNNFDEPIAITVADFDGDGRPDIATSNYASPSAPHNIAVAVYRNTSANGVLSFSTEATYGSSGSYYDICSGDLDGDGKPEIIYANTVNGQANSLKVLRNTSTFNNVSFAVAPDISALNGPYIEVGVYPYVDAIGGLNGDNKPDIATMGEGFDDVVLKQNGSDIGTISFPSGATFANSEQPAGIVIGDLNGDGKPEICTAIYTYNDSSIAILENEITDSITVIICPGTTNTRIGINKTGTNYQWQINTGSGFVDLNNDANYSGVNMDTLQLNTTVLSNGYHYRCVVDGVNGRIATIQFLQIPLQPAGADTTICLGDSASIGNPNNNSPTGYDWRNPSGPFPFLQTVDPVSKIKPGATDSCFLSYMQQGCAIYDTIIVTVNPAFSISAGRDTSICLNGSASIGDVAVGGNTYSWSSVPAGFASNNANAIVSPAINTAYYLTGSNGTCTSRDTVLVTVNNSIVNAGNDTTICSANTINIGTTTVNGTIYSWSSNPVGFISTNANPIVSPVVTTQYYLTAVNGVCTLKDTITVNTVNNTLVLTVGNDTTICAGTQALLTANGGAKYLWTPDINVSDTGIADPLASPTSTTRYKVTAYDIYGCAATDSILVNVLNAPIADAGPDKNICTGSRELIGSSPLAGNTYFWSPATGLSAVDIAQPIANPGSIETYILTVMNVQGCIAKDTLTINVSSFATNIPDTLLTVCSGTSAEIGIVAQTSCTYSWTSLPGNFTSALSDPSVSPLTNTVYHLEGTNTVAGCSISEWVNVLISDSCNTASVYPNPATDYINVQLYANNTGAEYFELINSYGAVILKQQLNVSTTTIGVKPLIAGIYYYTIKDANGQRLKFGKIIIAH